MTMQQETTYTFEAKPLTVVLTHPDTKEETREEVTGTHLSVNGHPTGLAYWYEPMKPYANQYIITHVASGLRVPVGVFTPSFYLEETVQRIIQQIAPLADWTLAREEFLATHRYQELGQRVRLIVEACVQKQEETYGDMTTLDAYNALAHVLECHARHLSIEDDIPSLKRLLIKLAKQVETEEDDED